MDEYSKKITVFFFILENKTHAIRAFYHAPLVGDEVKLNTGVYVVTRKCWLFDDDTHAYQYINIEIEPV